MDKVIEKLLCTDGSCCCVEPKTTIILISSINMVLCIVDLLSIKSCPCRPLGEFVDNVRVIIVTLFLLANVMLLLCGSSNNSLAVRVYVWYAMGFIVMGFIISIADLLTRFLDVGLYSIVGFVPEVLFLFVLYQCLPLLETFRKHLDTKLNEKSVLSLKGEL